jgi:selenocysteine lyase/cysteine desulfurase
MAFSRYISETKAALQTYPGFRLFVALIYLSSLLLLTIPELRSHGVDEVSRSFIWGYWTATIWRVGEFLLLVSLWIAVFLTDSLRYFHQRQFGRYRQETVPFGWTVGGRILGTLCVACAIYVIPFLDLHIPTLALTVGKLALSLSPVIPYISLFSGEDTGGTIESLSRLRFDNRYFDAAALAPLRSPVAEQIGECLEHCEKGPSDPDTQIFIRNGERGTPWGGIDDLFSRLGNFLSVPPSSITFHERTTSAISFALEEIVRNRRLLKLAPARVLTTDIEYPGIIGDLLPGLEQQRDIELLPPVTLRRLICTGATKDRVHDVLDGACKNLKPDVVLISHVYYGSGFLVDLEALIRTLDEFSRPILIVDGAQSIGNVEVTSRLFQQIEYYATGAHKWLMVPRHLGILVRDAELLRNKHKFADFEVPNRPDSSFPLVSKPFSVTISYDPYFGLSSLLRDELQVIRMQNIATHNHRLAELFRNEMLALGHRAIGDDNHSSIISVPFDGLTEPLHRSLQSNGVKCKYLKIDLDEGSVAVIRFCFHFHHSKDDVFRLLDVIENSLLRVRT